MKKYSPVIISGIITGIGFESSHNYHKKIIDIVFPSDDELNNMSIEDKNEWIKKNNNLMENIIDFLNSKNNEINTTT